MSAIANFGIDAGVDKLVMPILQARVLTLTIRGADFRAEDLTVENGFDYVAIPGKMPAFSQRHQAGASKPLFITDKGAGSYFVHGPNGAGKSTTLRMLVGH